MAQGYEYNWEGAVPFQIRGYYLGYNVVSQLQEGESHGQNYFLSDYKMWENKKIIERKKELAIVS